MLKILKGLTDSGKPSVSQAEYLLHIMPEFLSVVD